MVAAVLVGLRVAQMISAFVILGLTAYVANWYNVDTMTSSPSQINFLLFASFFTIVSVLYLELAPRFAPRVNHPYAGAALEVINLVFYFAGFIALSAFMGKLLFCRGTVCGAANASIAFGVIEFLLWGASSALMGKDLLKGGLASRRGGRTQAAMGMAAPQDGPQMKESQLA